jgi:Fic family protein
MTGQDREYLQTHPWLTFDVTRQLDRAPARLWRLLGAVVALAEHLADTPMLPEYADRMHRVYLIKGAVATTAIEGNTLSEEQVRQLIDKQLQLPPSKEYLGTEVENMLRAFDEIMTRVSRGEAIELSTEMIKGRNRQVLLDLALEPGVVAGEVSEHGVVVGPYLGAPRRDCDYLTDRLCVWLERGLAVADGEDPMATAVIQALLAHLYLAWIHGFGDGNGRTARLVEFQILAAGGVPGPAAHLLSNHFNDTRTEYYRQLNYASRSGGEVVPFLIYALQGFYDGLQTQLNELREQTEVLMWRELVDQAIPGHKPPDGRQRQLAMALFSRRRTGPVRRGELPSLTVELTLAYFDRTSKTLTRDLHVLIDSELVVQEGKGSYRAAEERILGLMPRRAASGDGGP